MTLKQYFLPGDYLHSPLSKFNRLLAPVASDLPIGEVFNKTMVLIYYYAFYLSDKVGNSDRIMTEVSVSHSPGLYIHMPLLTYFFICSSFFGCAAACWHIFINTLTLGAVWQFLLQNLPRLFRSLYIPPWISRF